jgi:hypothetical protein
MRVLVACEFSGVVRDAFVARGHDAVSCDLLPSERPGPHIVGDVRNILHQGWDLMIAHPPCTFPPVARSISTSAAAGRTAPMATAGPTSGTPRVLSGHARGADPAHRVENPIMLGHVRRLFDIPTPSQTIQPWQHGHPETKATCLWLKGLPRLRPTKIVDGREARVHREPLGPERWRNRSRTYPGVAAAMAKQWGNA